MACYRDSFASFYYYNKETGNLRWYSDGLLAGLPGFDSRQGYEIFLYSTLSGAHPSSYQMGIGVLFLVVKWQDVKLTTHLHLVPRSRMDGAIILVSLRLHGIVLNCITKTTDSLNLLSSSSSSS
jgi:hypothetical protein